MIELKNSEFLRDAIDTISSFIPEGNFRFSDAGLAFKAIDPSQVLLVDYFIDKSLFDKYNIEPNFVGIDLVEFNKTLQRAMPQDKLLLDLSDAELKLRLESDLKRSFRLPLIDINEDEAKTPQIEYSTKVIIGSVSFKELLRDAALFGTSIVFKVTNGKFSVEATGSQGKMDSEASAVSKIMSSKDVVSKFSLSFLQKIAKDVDPSQKITIELKEESPMKVSYNIGKSKIVFHLAHMIL